MNLLYLIPHLYNSGGMERVLCQKANWLAKHTEHRIVILTTEHTPEGLQDSYFPLDERIETTCLGIDFDADFLLPLYRKYPNHQRKMRQYKELLNAFIQKEKIDLCISLGGKEVAFLPQMPCRTLAELHFAKNERLLRIQAHHAGLFWSILGRIRVRQMVRELKRFERFVVLTEADRLQWAEAGCKQALVIPNPCSLCGITLPALPREKEVLAVGRLHPQKGFDRLLRAWAPLEKRFPDWRLTIVGEGPERQHLETLIQSYKLDRVSLVGAQNHIERYYSRASLLAMTSRYEGLPLAMIEAMWCGTPCVSMNCPHGPEELIQKGGGLLVENGDISAMTNALSMLMSDDGKRIALGQKAQRYAQNAFSETTILNQWLQLINDKTYNK